MRAVPTWQLLPGIMFGNHGARRSWTDRYAEGRQRKKREYDRTAAAIRDVAAAKPRP